MARAFLKKKNLLKNVKKSSYNNSISKPVLYSTILEPTLTFIADFHNKACKKLVVASIPFLTEIVCIKINF